MTIRVAATEVSHWHALNDASYLRHLVAMPHVELVAVQDSDAGLVARRAAEVGVRRRSQTTERCWRRPGPISSWRSGGIARWPASLMICSISVIPSDGEATGDQRAEVEAVAAKAARLNASVAVPLAQRYGPFATRARELLASGAVWPAVAHLRSDQPAGARTLRSLGLRVDAQPRRGRRRVPPEPRAATGWICFST